MSDDHATLPLALPSLDHLTTEELGSLRSKVQLVSREARKRAIQVIGREPRLKKPWGRSLGFTKDTTPEERQEIQRELERELLRCPDAYLAHAWANSLVILDTAVRDELLRRTGSAVPKKKSAPTPAPPPPPPAPKLLPKAAPEPEPEDDAVDGADLAAMFDQATGDE